MLIATPDPESPQQELKQSYARLVERFGKAWESGKGDQMAEVFAEEGTFCPSPFDEALRGRQAILQYWTDIPQEQAEISFRYGEMFVAGPWFSTEFRCTFRRRRTGDWVDVRGSLFCETSAGEIAEMRMYWHRVTGAQKNQ